MLITTVWPCSYKLDDPPQAKDLPLRLQTEIHAMLPIKTVSVLNVREHWSKRAKRAKQHRASAYYYLLIEVGTKRPELPVTVTITRVAPRELDGDNLQGALKACRDGIADYFGTDDRNAGIEWRYAQGRGAAREYGVKIDISQSE